MQSLCKNFNPVVFPTVHLQKRTTNSKPFRVGAGVMQTNPCRLQQNNARRSQQLPSPIFAKALYGQTSSSGSCSYRPKINRELVQFYLVRIGCHFAVIPINKSTDHGLLAICLHANGANVIAGDRAAGPLDVARENTRLYLHRAQKLSESSFSSSFVARTKEERGTGASRGRRYIERDGADGVGDDVAEQNERPIQGRGGFVAAAAEAVALPRLECRLGDGLAVLEHGEVDTVCIAGVGAYILFFLPNVSYWFRVLPFFVLAPE